MALIHHVGCGACARCLTRARVDLRALPGADDRPRRVRRARARARLGRAARRGSTTRSERTSSRSRACCAGPSACHVGACSSSATASSAGSSAPCSSGAVTPCSRSTGLRSGRAFAPDGPVDAAVLCAPGGGEVALAAVEPGGTVLLFADAGMVPADGIYRRELTVIGSRSATPAHMAAGGRAPPHARPAGADGAAARALRRRARDLSRGLGPEGGARTVSPPRTGDRLKPVTPGAGA